MKSGIEIIEEERNRHFKVGGYTPEQYVEFADESMAYAAACYAIPANSRNVYAGPGGISNILRILWPKSWSSVWWEPSPENRIKELAKAGALIAAEIDRLNKYHKINIQ